MTANDLMALVLSQGKRLELLEQRIAELERQTKEPGRFVEQPGSPLDRETEQFLAARRAKAKNNATQ